MSQCCRTHKSKSQWTVSPASRIILITRLLRMHIWNKFNLKTKMQCIHALRIWTRTRINSQSRAQMKNTSVARKTLKTRHQTLSKTTRLSNPTQRLTHLPKMRRALWTKLIWKNKTISSKIYQLKIIPVHNTQKNMCHKLNKCARRKKNKSRIRSY